MIKQNIKLKNMKKIIFTSFALGMVLISCKKEAQTTTDTLINDTIEQSVSTETDTLNEMTDGHNAQNSLDWAGTYEAVLPCADCPGIKTTIVLNNDGTYQYTAEYQERNLTINSTGEIMWHDNGSVVHLKDKDTDVKLKVVENGLVGLDTSGNEIDGALKEHYNYKKVK